MNEEKNDLQDDKDNIYFNDVDISQEEYIIKINLIN